MPGDGTAGNSGKPGENPADLCLRGERCAWKKYEPVENGIRAEGTITAELLYITTDDNMPIQSAREIYPFSQILEIPDMQPDAETQMDCG